MKDEDKKKDELVSELAEMRRQIAKREKAEITHKQIEEELRNSQKRLKILFEFAPDGYYLNDLKGTFIDGNRAAERMIGYKRQELIGKNFLQLKLLPPTQIPKAAAVLAKNALGQSSGPDELTLRRKDGKKITVEIRTFPMEIENKRVVLGIARDVTESKKMEGALRKAQTELERRVQERTAELSRVNAQLVGEINKRRKAEETLRNLIELAPDLIVTVDLKGIITSANQAILGFAGYSKDELIGKHFSKLASLRGRDIPEFMKLFASIVRGKVHEPFEVNFQHKDGTSRWAEVHLSLVRVNGKKVGIQTIARDITERKQKEKQFFYMATHDTLTGLSNRTLFSDRLTLALHQAERNQSKLCVMLLDLDNFKDINDELGHSVGDKLLQGVGSRLRGLLRKSDTIARMGGDEFLLLLPEIHRVEDATTNAQKLLEAIREPFTLDGRRLLMTTSIGLAIYPDDGKNADILVSHADIAMYQAKQRGRNNWQCYSPRVPSSFLS